MHFQPHHLWLPLQTEWRAIVALHVLRGHDNLSFSKIKDLLSDPQSPKGRRAVFAAFLSMETPVEDIVGPALATHTFHPLCDGLVIAFPDKTALVLRQDPNAPAQFLLPLHSHLVKGPQPRETDTLDAICPQWAPMPKPPVGTAYWESNTNTTPYKFPSLEPTRRINTALDTLTRHFFATHFPECNIKRFHLTRIPASTPLDHDRQVICDIEQRTTSQGAPLPRLEKHPFFTRLLSGHRADPQVRWFWAQSDRLTVVQRPAIQINISVPPSGHELLDSLSVFPAMHELIHSPEDCR